MFERNTIISVLFLVEGPNHVVSSSEIYQNKRKCSHKKKVIKKSSNPAGMI